MDQETLNRNIVHSLSIINKAVISLQVKLIAVAMQDTHTMGIADLTRMDHQALTQLQDTLDRMKKLV